MSEPARVEPPPLPSPHVELLRWWDDVLATWQAVSSDGHLHTWISRATASADPVANVGRMERELGERPSSCKEVPMMSGDDSDRGQPNGGRESARDLAGAPVDAATIERALGPPSEYGKARERIMKRERDDEERARRERERAREGEARVLWKSDGPLPGHSAPTRLIADGNRVRWQTRYGPGVWVDGPFVDVRSVVLLLAERTAALEAAQARIAELEGRLQCDACGGTGKPISGRPCGCSGTGSALAMLDYLRQTVFDQEGQLLTERAANEALRQALTKFTKYGRHQVQCASNYINFSEGREPYPCNCGLAETLATDGAAAAEDKEGGDAKDKEGGDAKS